MEKIGEELLEKFRSRHFCLKLSERIKELAGDKDIRIMEVCGTHTVAIHRWGIKSLLPENLHLISGPGCPVCVTHQSDIEAVMSLAKRENTILTTFGDMMRVPASSGSLAHLRAQGYDIRVMYSPLEALHVAQDNPEKDVIFFAIGFETTQPALARILIEAAERGIKNFSIYPACKLIPPAMEALLISGSNIDGFICPGHVSVIIGAKAYEPIAEKFHKPCVVAGFEPVDILLAIYKILLITKGTHDTLVDIEYTRCVSWEGNIRAQEAIKEVFQTSHALWRGLGEIPSSGLGLREEFLSFDARMRFEIEIPTASEEVNPACRCGDVLRGLIEPDACPLFGNVCTPANPQGPCMVSSEGTCSAYYRWAGAR